MKIPRVVDNLTQTTQEIQRYGFDASQTGSTAADLDAVDLAIVIFSLYYTAVCEYSGDIDSESTRMLH